MSTKAEFLCAARWCKSVEALSEELSETTSKISFFMVLFGIEKLPHDPQRTTAQEIIKAVSEESGISVSDIKGRSRQRKIVEQRNECFRRIRRLGYSYPQIGRLFKRHHSTVMYALQKTADNSMETAS